MFVFLCQSLCFFKERVGGSSYLGTRGLLSHLIKVNRAHLNLALVSPEIYQSFDLSISNKASLQPFRLASFSRHVEHISPTQQFLSTYHVQYSPGVHLRSNGETNAGREVSLNKPGNDIYRRALCSYNKMNACSPGQLGQPTKCMFYLVGCRHH